jgi:hypothetical protein
MEEGVMTRDDPLLAALADAAQRKQRAERDIRLLLAYAREHTPPRPYRLADLAQAAASPSPVSAPPTAKPTSSKPPA